LRHGAAWCSELREKALLRGAVGPSEVAISLATNGQSLLEQRRHGVGVRTVRADSYARRFGIFRPWRAPECAESRIAREAIVRKIATDVSIKDLFQAHSYFS